MPSLQRADIVEVGASCALAVAAALALLLPDGSGLRFVLALPVLLFVPGHLLVTACTRAPRDLTQRGMRALVAFGVSLPLVGLLALSTALLPNGFRASSIVAVITGACVLFTAAALWRRRVTNTVPDGLVEGEAVAA